MQTSKILTGLLSVTLMVSSLLFGQEKKDAPKDAPKDRLSLSSESLKINGDLRIRYEWRERDINNVEDHRNRFRTRFRLGANFTVSPEVNIHAGLASGGNSSGTSSNQTWNTNSEWETHSIWLDYAYAEIIFGKELPRLMAGVQKNPYVSSNLLLDGDLCPTGYTITHKFDPVFMTMGWYNLRHRTFGGINDRADGNMVAAQVGVATKGDISFTAALGYFHANNQYSYVIFGPTTDYKFRVVDVYGDVSVKVAKDVK
ncbi:MAG: putative porin, partial [Candidatus Bathyarchaeia archaeon]